MSSLGSALKDAGITSNAFKPGDVWLCPNKILFLSDDALKGRVSEDKERPVVVSVDEKAGQFLLGFLKGGRRLARDGWDASRTAGIGERAIRRAHAELGVRFEVEGSPPCWWWSLP